MKMELVVETGEQRDLAFVADRLGTYRLGRDQETDLALIKDKYVSRHHCAIELTSAGAWLRDEESHAGIFVNGTQVTEAQLADGDTLLIGQTAVRVSLVGVAPPPLPIERPAGVPNFTLVKKLPTSGPGEVWWAYSKQTRRVVSLHCLPLLTPTNPTDRDRFMREAAICARLRHPGLTRFLTQGYTPDNKLFWFATELSDGVSLGQFIKEQGPLPVSQAIDVLSQVLGIVAYLHQEAVIHRSLRPDSFVVKEQSNRFKVWLTDLGSAKCFQITELSPITVLGEPGNYPHHTYTAPTELYTPQYLDPRSDIYALGGILYFTLTGRAPDHIRAKPGTNQIDDLASLHPFLVELGIPSALIELIERAMSETVETQYNSIEEMQTALRWVIDHPIIQKPAHIQLGAEAEAVLRTMFSTFNQIAVEAQFGHGLSGSQVFRVRPVAEGSKVFLPAVVKIGPVGLIQQEWQAYQAWVEGTLPDIAQIEAAPTLSPNRPWEGLRYKLAGGGVFDVESLHTYYQQASATNLGWLLEDRLFKIIGLNWWLVNRVVPNFQMQANYDFLLPVNLWLEATHSPVEGDGYLIKPDYLPPPTLIVGDQVCLEGFVVTEVDQDRQEITLNVPPIPEDLPATSYRLRFTKVAPIHSFHVGQVVESLHGVIKETRQTLFLAVAGQMVTKATDLTAAQLPFSLDHFTLPLRRRAVALPSSLPNPLQVYQAILETFLRARVSTIHGDLNLENILVDPTTRQISLIDFATVRQGHALHDLLRLETEVVTKLIPVALAEAELPPEIIYLLYQQLDESIRHSGRSVSRKPLHPVLEKSLVMLNAIRQMARGCLFNPNDWSEYYRGLILYLLGALKFKNLDELPGAPAPLPKQVAFWGAAALVALLD